MLGRFVQDYVGKSNCELTQYEDGSLPDEFQYFGEETTGGVLGYADYCPMFYHYSNGDCRCRLDAILIHFFMICSL